MSNATEKLQIDAAMRAEKAEFRKKMEVVLTARLIPLIRSKDIYYVAESHKYMMYETESGWRSYSPEAMSKLMSLTKADDRELFDDVLRQMGRVKEYTAISFHEKPETVLNFLTMKDWLQPHKGDVHTIFDVLMSSLSDGKLENREHIEKCLVWKYLHPEDYRLPCITISGAGGAGKNEFVEQVLATILGERQVIALGTEQAFGQFNGQMIGKTIVFIDEAIVEKSDAETLKRKVGNKTISINEKYGLQGTYENTPWYWLGGNGTNGAVMLARDVTDRRYSVLTIKNSIMFWVCKHLGIAPPRIGEVLHDSHAAVQWYRENSSFLSNPESVAAWLYELVIRWGKQPHSPSALHSQDYLKVIESQKSVFEEALEFVFDRGFFSHIEGKTLYRVYQLMCEEASDRKMFTKTRNKFLADARQWLEQHHPEIEWTKAKLEIPNRNNQRAILTSASLFIAGGIKGPYECNTSTYIDKDDRGEESLRLINEREITPKKSDTFLLGKSS